MRSVALLILGMSVSSAVHAQMGMGGSYNQLALESEAKAYNCIAKIQVALNPMGGGAGTENSTVPFGINLEGKTYVSDQNRIVSRETVKDVEVIEYKVNQITGWKNGSPISESVRQTVQIKRKNGQIVSIFHPQDVRKMATARAAAQKQYGKEMADFKLLKSVETTFKDKGGACETDQKAYVMVKDENGKDVETQVTYDAGFCERLSPIIDRLGANNVSECAPLLSAAERAFADRSAELKKEGKNFHAFGMMDLGKDSAKFQNSTSNMSLAISACVQERSSGRYTAGMGAYPYGAQYNAVGMMSSGMAAPTPKASSGGGSKTKSKSEPAVY